MGYYPRQDFVYGVMIDECPVEIVTNAESNGFDVARGDNGEAVIGFKLDSHASVENGYIGGRWVTRFKKDYFDSWCDEVRAKTTPDVAATLKEVTGAKDEPTLWTISTMG